MSATICPACLKVEGAADGVRSVFYFEGPIKEAIYQLKYHNIRAAARFLATFMARYLTGETIPGDVVVPVPLHPRRLRERGYNQSALLAREVARLDGLAYSEALVRTSYSLPQVKASGLAARRENVKGAFTCARDSVKGRQVLLIDDVVTSGSTLDACALALKSQGAESVWALTLAREVLNP